MKTKKAGCILMNTNTKKIALVYRDKEYSFPKGHLEEGETLKECAIRETREETGHDCRLISNEEIVIIYYSTPSGEEVENHMYLAIDEGETKEIIDEKDKEICVWKKIEEIEETLSYQNLKDAWKEIKIIVKNKMNKNK